MVGENDNVVTRRRRNVDEAYWCNCCAFLVALLVSVSPYYLWSYGFSSQFNAQVRIGTGSFVVSTASSSVNRLYGSNIVMTHNWVYWSDITSELACTDNGDSSSNSSSLNIYESWSGKYGYCDNIGGTFSIPSEAKVLQAFTILTVVFSFLAFVVGSCAAEERAKYPSLAGVFSFLAMFSAIVTFSTVASSDVTKDLTSGGGVIPMWGILNNSVVLLPVPVTLYHGPSFWAMIWIFIMTSFTSVVYCTGGLSRKKDKYGESFDTSKIIDAEDEYESLLKDEAISLGFS